MKIFQIILHPKEAMYLRKWKQRVGLEGYEQAHIIRRYVARNEYVELSWRFSVNGVVSLNSLYSRCLWSEIEQTIRMTEERDLKEEVALFQKENFSK